MELREQTIKEMVRLLSEEQVITDENVIIENEGATVHNYEKAFGHKNPHQPLCVVNVKNKEEIKKVLTYCNENKIHVIARTGASSSEDQLLVIDDQTIIVDASAMNRLIKLDTENMMATVECGMPLAQLEKLANEKGLTTGHSPQSSPLAHLGGLVATRSIGQFSTYYGGIEDMLCGLEAILPNGETVRIKNAPRRSAGPDLRHFFLGSEGAWAFMTEITVKLFPYYPDDMWIGGYIVENFHKGLDCIREIMTKGYKPSVVRLYDKPDVDHNYGSVKLKDEEAFMFFSAEGPKEIAQATGESIHKIAMSYDAEYIGTKAVEHWFVNRNNLSFTVGTQEEKDRFLSTHISYATIEVCADWTDIHKIYDDVMAALPEKCPNLTMFGGHVSHSYINGTNIYFVYNLKIQDSENATAEHYQVMEGVCDEVLKYETGTIAHHHGIGKVRVRKIKEELGSSFPLVRMIKDQLDPNGIMNPGTLLPLK